MDSVKANTINSGADLVTRIKAGDRRAEEELVERYSRGVLIIIKRAAGNIAAVDDLYQETFRLVLEKIRNGDIREPDRLSGFIASLAKNLVIDHFRRNARQERFDSLDEASPLPAAAHNQLDELLQKEKARIIRQVLKEMKSDRDRQLLFRFYISEDDKEEICADLGLTSLHFNRVLFRARERYKQLYEKSIS